MSLLFSREPLADFLEREKINLKREIESTEVNYLLNVSENDYVDYLVQKHSFSALALHDANITQPQGRNSLFWKCLASKRAHTRIFA